MNLNIFKRIAYLEEQVQQADAQIDLLTTIVCKHAKLIKTLEDAKQAMETTKQTDSDKIEKRRAYARAYYQATKAKRAK